MQVLIQNFNQSRNATHENFPTVLKIRLILAILLRLISVVSKIAINLAFDIVYLVAQQINPTQVTNLPQVKSKAFG